MSGPTEQLSVTGDVQGQALGWNTLRPVNLSTTVGWDQASESVSLTGLEASSPFGSVRGDAELVVAEGGGPSRTNLTLRDVDLARLSNTPTWLTVTDSSLAICR